jgi:hypothetical protein
MINILSAFLGTQFEKHRIYSFTFCRDAIIRVPPLSVHPFRTVILDNREYAVLKLRIIIIQFNKLYLWSALIANI